MKKKTLSRYWPVMLILVGIALVTVAVIGSTPAQASASEQSPALQGTPPPATIPAPTVIIPQTGGDNDVVIVDLFSSWVLWAVLGLLLVVILVAFIARPRRPVEPPEPHHHHDL